MQGVGVILLICLATAVAPGHACSPPAFWRPESFQERLQQATVVFRGKVTSTDAPRSGGRGIYQATFEVECFYNGLYDTGPKSITIGGFGWDYGLCSNTQVQVGKDYVIFADTYGSGTLQLADINVQSGATEATSDVIAQVEQSYSCGQPTD